MRFAVVYSSLTGNTKLVAEAIREVMPVGTEIFPVEEAPSPEQFDCLLIGFWANRGLPADNMREYMEGLRNKKVGIFITLGAYPNSEHADQCIKSAQALLRDHNDIRATFICQGKVDPELTKRFANLPPEHPHAMTPERRARHEAAKSHPDEQDLTMAKDVFRKMRSEILGHKR